MPPKHYKRRHTTALYVRDVPTDVKAAFKAFCARRDYTMRDAIVALMRKTANGDVKLVLPRVQ